MSTSIALPTASSLSHDQQRSEPRFALPLGSKIKASFLADTSALAAQILDLSVSGAKLRMDRPLAIKSQGKLTFACAAIGYESTISATICWARPMGRGQWWVGCAFDSSLPTKELDLLARSGHLERRKDHRSKHEVAAQLKLELQPEPLVVRICNSSSGGFSVLTPRETTEGERVLLSFPTDSKSQRPILARVQWCQRTDAGFQTGCTFLTKDGYAETRKRCGAHGAFQYALQSYSHSWLIILLGVATAGFAAYMAFRYYRSRGRSRGRLRYLLGKGRSRGRLRYLLGKGRSRGRLRY